MYSKILTNQLEIEKTHLDFFIEVSILMQPFQGEGLHIMTRDINLEELEGLTGVSIYYQQNEREKYCTKFYHFVMGEYKIIRQKDEQYYFYEPDKFMILNLRSKHKNWEEVKNY